MTDSSGNVRSALEDYRAAVEEHEQAVDALARVAEARGQGDRSLPLVVADSDLELRAAVDRELAAQVATRRAAERLHPA